MAAEGISFFFFFGNRLESQNHRPAPKLIIVDYCRAPALHPTLLHCGLKLAFKQSTTDISLTRPTGVITIAILSSAVLLLATHSSFIILTHSRMTTCVQTSPDI